MRDVLSPEQVRDLALAVLRDAPFPILATEGGGHPRARPVSPVKTDGFTVYVASMRSSNKTEEIERNPRVELCYMTEGHDQVRISGVAETVTDRAVRQEIWNANPLLRAYLGDVDNSEFVLYRVVPNRVRYMREWALVYDEAPL